MNGIASLVLVCLCGHLTTASWTQTHRNQILKIHNDYRRGVKDACDMTDMSYDRGIEAKARAWAQKCVFKHEGKGYGENIAWVTKYGQESKLIPKMAKMWYDEVKDYTYGMRGCGAACHYTQLIWANTKKVGCYAAKCPVLRKGGKNAYFLVCFYSPPGNYLGEQPYKKNCSNKGNKNKGGPNPVPSTKKNNNKKKNNNNNNNNWEDWEKEFNKIGGDGWQPFPQGNNDGWQVVKKTSGNGNGGTWTTYTARRTNK